MAYSGGTGKSGDGRATYHGPSGSQQHGHWHSPSGRRVSGPDRRIGDRDSGYYYSSRGKGSVKRKY